MGPCKPGFIFRSTHQNSTKKNSTKNENSTPNCPKLNITGKFKIYISVYFTELHFFFKTQQLFQQMPLFLFKTQGFFQNSTDFYQNSTLPANLLRAFAEFRRKMKPVLSTFKLMSSLGHFLSPPWPLLMKGFLSWLGTLRWHGPSRRHPWKL